MQIRTIKSDGLAHLSYLIIDGTAAAVIDPRRDVDVYLRAAREAGASIRYIFETHRNEDLVSGAAALKERTGAPVFHGPNADGDVQYAQTLKEGERFELDQAFIEVLETPGHTFDSVSYVLYDKSTGDAPLGVFSGDTLFVGDVGRADFYPDRAEEVAGKLYESLQKLLALGDQTIVYPAHGAGSVCGSGMADRDFTTIGYERACNPRLQLASRDDFVRTKLAEHHTKPPYFQRMEQLNLVGATATTSVTVPRALSPSALDDLGSAALVDVRPVAAFLGAHLPGSLALPTGMLSAYAGWLLEYDAPLVLIADSPDQAQDATVQLMRMGFDHVEGFLAAPIPGSPAAGRPFGRIAAVDAQTVHDRLNDRSDWQLLDVRAADEFGSGHIKGAENIFLGELADQLDDLDPNVAYTTQCASGARATIAASVLARAGFHVNVFLGSLGAWKAAGYPIEGAGQ